MNAWELLHFRRSAQHVPGRHNMFGHTALSIRRIYGLIEPQASLMGKQFRKPFAVGCLKDFYAITPAGARLFCAIFTLPNSRIAVKSTVVMPQRSSGF